MKKKVIILGFAICLLLFAIVNVKKANKEPLNFLDMDVDYINTNYDLNLFEERIDNNLELTINGMYIGNDIIVEYPEITLKIECLYEYTDFNETFTDRIDDEIILIDDGVYLDEKVVFALNQNILDSYSCFYNVVNAKGKYLEK